MVASMALFSCEDALIKSVSAELPVGQILILIGVGGFLVLSAIAWMTGVRVVDRAFLSTAVLARNGGELVGTIGFVTALTLIPISTASVILQASPLVVTMGAALFLGERVGWRRWTAILVGLIGVVVILRPGMEGFEPNMLWAVLGVVGLSLRDLVTRRVPPSVSTLQLSAWAFAILVPAGILTLGIGAPPAVPSADAALKLAFGLGFGLCGYATLTIAVRGGDLSVVAPFRYSRIVFALILGAIVFAERPDLPMIIGATLIVGSGLYSLIREARLRRRAARPSLAAGAPL